MMHVNLSISGQSLRQVTAAKVDAATPHVRDENDAVYEYEWKIKAGSRVVALGVLKHRYGDGPLVLLQKILAAAKLDELPERKR